VLARLPADLDLETLARETKAIERRRGPRSGAALLRLSMAWSCGGRSLQCVAAGAMERGIVALTEEALIQRLHRAGLFLQAVTNRLLPGAGARPSWQGRGFRIADSTSLSGRAAGGRFELIDRLRSRPAEAPARGQRPLCCASSRKALRQFPARFGQQLQARVEASNASFGRMSGRAPPSSRPPLSTQSRNSN
jgi:hypothetical protein